MNGKVKPAAYEKAWWKIKRVSSNSRGVFNSSEWVKQGDGLLASAKILRSELASKREEFRALGENGGQPSQEQWVAVGGIPGASFLLLGYSVEMYLKACLANVCIGCPEEMLYREFRKFSHSLIDLAKEVEFVPAETSYDGAFELLTEMIKNGGRYPLEPNEERNVHAYIRSWNTRSSQTNNDDRFYELCDLAGRIKAHANALRGTRQDPLSSKTILLEPDGHLVYRVGGSLRPRITLSLGADMFKDGTSELDALHQFLAEQTPKLREIVSVWGNATMRYDTKDKRSGLVADWNEYLKSMKLR